MYAIGAPLVVVLALLAEHTAAQACNNGAGTCKLDSSCAGTTLVGLCPGPTNIKCCIPLEGVGEACDGGKGTCMADTDCSGATKMGLCPGPASVKCCIPPPPECDGQPLPAIPPPPHHPPPSTLGDGSGPWASQSPGFKDHATEVAYRGVAATADGLGLDNAARNMRHYLDGSGTDFSQPVEEMLADLPALEKEIVALVQSQASTALFGLPTGCPKTFASGWSTYSLTIKDEELGRLHVVGLAQEYTARGTSREHFVGSFSVGGRVPEPSSSGGNGRGRF